MDISHHTLLIHRICIPGDTTRHHAESSSVRRKKSCWIFTLLFLPWKIKNSNHSNQNFNPCRCRSSQGRVSVKFSSSARAYVDTGKVSFKISFSARACVDTARVSFKISFFARACVCMNSENTKGKFPSEHYVTCFGKQNLQAREIHLTLINSFDDAKPPRLLFHTHRLTLCCTFRIVKNSGLLGFISGR